MTIHVAPVLSEELEFFFTIHSDQKTWVCYWGACSYHYNYYSYDGSKEASDYLDGQELGKSSALKKHHLRLSNDQREFGKGEHTSPKVSAPAMTSLPLINKRLRHSKRKRAKFVHKGTQRKLLLPGWVPRFRFLYARPFVKEGHTQSDWGIQERHLLKIFRRVAFSNWKSSRRSTRIMSTNNYNEDVVLHLFPLREKPETSTRQHLNYRRLFLSLQAAQPRVNATNGTPVYRRGRRLPHELQFYLLISDVSIKELSLSMERMHNRRNCSSFPKRLFVPTFLSFSTL